jgi:hypothetical protein
MDRNGILDLALETLERRRAKIQTEIRELKGGTGQSGVAGRRRSRTSAERRAQSLRMKQIWARKRAARESAAAKPSTSKDKGTAKSAKSRAISEGMRAYWAKRKARAARSAGSFGRRPKTGLRKGL